MKPRAFSLLGLLIASCAGPAPLPFRVDPNDFNPLEVGMDWAYSTGGPFVQRRKVTGVQRVGRFDCRIVEAQTEKATEKHWMRSEKDGLKVYRVSAGLEVIDFDDPLVLIKYPAVPGVRWAFEERHGLVTLDVAGAYEADEDVQVKKRTLRCARIRLVKSVQGQTVLDQTSWYARGVGLVKTTVAWTEEGRDMTRTLQLIGSNLLGD